MMNSSVSKQFERWARFVAGRPWSILMLALLVIGGFASRIPQIVVDTSVEGFLHADDPTMVAYDDFRERFGRDDSIVVGIETDDPFTLEFLERLRDFHEDLEENIPYLDEITSMLNARWTRGSDDQLLVEDLISEWPTDDADLTELRERVYANPLYLDNLITRDGRITTVLIDADTFVQTGIDEEGIPIQRYLTDHEQREIVEAVRNVIEHHEGPGFQIHAVGILWMADRLAFRLLQDNPKLVGRGLVVMAVILFALFGSIRGVVLPLLVVISALLVTFGSLPLLGMPYQLPTQVVGLSLLAIGVGDAIHVIAMYYHFTRAGRHTVDALADAFAHAGPAILMTSLTTGGALMSFSWAEIAPISNLGILLPIGVAAAFAATVTILPALLVVLPDPKRAPRQRGFVFIERGLKTAGLWSADHPLTVLGGVMIVLVVSLAGITQVKFSHNPMFWFPEGNTFRESTLLLNDRLGGVVTLEVLFDTDEQDAVKDPALLEALDEVASRNKEYGEDSESLRIGKTISIVDLLKETNRALNENRDSSYELPDNRELIAQELLLFELSGSDDLADLADYEYSTARMTIRTPWVDATRLGPFSDGLVEDYRDRVGDLADVSVTGRVPVLTRTMTAVIQSMTTSYLIAFAAVAPLMMLFLGSAGLGLVAMIPNLLPIIAALGLMGLLGLPLDAFSLLTGSIALGLAVDDTIHFMHGVRRESARTGDIRHAVEYTLTVTGQALFSTTLILCCGFGLFASAYMQNMVNFGYVTAFALAMALLADILVAPALVSLLARRGHFGGRA
jgi:predicted RND superfamily exporter protein